MTSPRPVPRISLVTSSFNEGHTIGRTIESALAQRYPNLEHIIVDGMSTDGTVEILAKFPHLTVIREPTNGQPDAINKGFRAATGEIFGVLNPDDTLAPGALRAVADALDPGAGRHVVMGRCRVVDHDDEFLGIERPSAFESHRRVLEIWKGHSLPQPAIFWTRQAWEACGPLDINDASTFDFDLFCRLSRRYPFHRLDRVLANSRLYLQSTTSSHSDEERFEQAVAVSRRYWGSPLGSQYWQLRASHAAFRANRRVRAVKLLRAGRTLYRDQHRLRGLGRLIVGVLLAPDVVTDVLLLPRVKPALLKIRTHSFTWRRSVKPQTSVWFGFTKLHDDGWAGPTLEVDLAVGPTQTAISLTGSTMGGHLSRPLQLNAFLDGRSLGRRHVGRDAQFSVTWDLGEVAAGQHALRIVANTYIVPNQAFGGDDYRPLSYQVIRLEAAAPA